MFKIKIMSKIMITIKRRYTKHFRKKVAFLTFSETINFSVSFIKTVLKELYYNLCVFVSSWPNDYILCFLWQK